MTFLPSPHYTRVWSQSQKVVLAWYCTVTSIGHLVWSDAKQFGRRSHRDASTVDAKSTMCQNWITWTMVHQHWALSWWLQGRIMDNIEAKRGHGHIWSVLKSYLNLQCDGSEGTLPMQHLRACQNMLLVIAGKLQKLEVCKAHKHITNLSSLCYVQYWLMDWWTELNNLSSAWRDGCCALNGSVHCGFCIWAFPQHFHNAAHMTRLGKLCH